MSDPPLLGLPVALPDTCKSCGSRDAIVGEGRGPHRAALHCRGCTAHRGWIGVATYDFLVGVVAKFGRPDQPIAIERGGNPTGKSIGFISDHSFQASSPTTAAQTTDDRAPLTVDTEATEAESDDGEEKCPWD